MKDFLALSMPNAPAFAGLWQDCGSKMLYVDLERAGMPSASDSGERLDFHAPRHICGTRLAALEEGGEARQGFFRDDYNIFTLRNLG
ncbi:MAG: hypothetical protein LBE84_08875 [Planctomycetota bacterium]|jgi:hypothetical protein|nr:hypothetical protein [Planctomycetota bacterium]